MGVIHIFSPFRFWGNPISGFGINKWSAGMDFHKNHCQDFKR